MSLLRAIARVSVHRPSTNSGLVRRSYATEAKALKFSLSCPHNSIVKDREVSLVQVPGVTGEFGVLAEHVPTISELKPGVVTVVNKDQSSERFFVSGGFAFVKADSTLNINAVEAVPVDQLDGEAAKEGLRKYTAEVTSATDDAARARAQIGVEVHQAICGALNINA